MTNEQIEDLGEGTHQSVSGWWLTVEKKGEIWELMRHSEEGGHNRAWGARAHFAEFREGVWSDHMKTAIYFWPVKDESECKEIEEILGATVEGCIKLRDMPPVRRWWTTFLPKEARWALIIVAIGLLFFN